MREKARKLVCLNAGNNISYNLLKNFYWYILIIPFMMVAMGIYLLRQNGISGKALFPLISIIIWTFLYWGLVLFIKRKHTKKSFELRFFVNGMVAFLISALMWSFFASWNVMSDNPFLEFNYFLWMIPIYLLISMVYIFNIVLGIHKGIYARIKVKKKTIAFLSTVITISVGLGIIVSRILRDTTSLKFQQIVMSIGSIVLIFIPILAHINFVQFFYCKKYGIKCDETGEYTSPHLCPPDNVRKNKINHENKNIRKDFSKLVLILICVLGIFLVAFLIKSIVQGFIQEIQGIT